jgi:hypothetical protein
MNSSQSYRRWFFSLIIPLMLLFHGLLAPKFAEAQPDEYQNPTIYLFILDEPDACKPTGYKSYDSEEPSVCVPKLTINDVVNLMSNCEPNVVEFPITVPSGQQFMIKLGPLFEAVSAYCEQNPATMSPRERKSMLILFDWKTAQTAKIDFRRIGNARIPKWNWPGSLNGENRWFNHQRLDAFYPVYNMKWRLTVGTKHWDFGVEP